MVKIEIELSNEDLDEIIRTLDIAVTYDSIYGLIVDHFEGNGEILQEFLNKLKEYK